MNIALDAADNTKDTVSIGVNGAYYTVNLPNGALSTWKTFRILDNNDGLMKVYYENCLIATVELSAVSGGEYKTVVVKDANGAEKAKKTDASVSANYNNMNFGVAQNAEGTTVPEGGMHIDNWGIVEFDFDETVNNPLPNTQTGLGEEPSNPSEPSEPSEPSSPETGDFVSLVVVVAAAVLVVTVLAKKKAY